MQSSIVEIRIRNHRCRLEQASSRVDHADSRTGYRNLVPGYIFSSTQLRTKKITNESIVPFNPESVTKLLTTGKS